MVDKDDPLQREASPSAPSAYGGYFRGDDPDDDGDDIVAPLPSHVPSAIARKLMKGSKRGKSISSISSQSRSSQTPIQRSQDAPQPTYRIIRGPPPAHTATRLDGPSHMASRFMSVPSESEPPSSSVTRVSSPDWEGPISSTPSGSRLPPGGTRGSPVPRRRGQSSKLRNVITTPASPQYETEAEFPPSSPYAAHSGPLSPHPAFTPRSPHPSAITSRHASLPPTSSHHSIQPLARHPSLPPSSPPPPFSTFSRHQSLQPSSPPPNFPSRSPHPSIYPPTPYPVLPPSSPSSSLPPRSQHPSLMPRQPPQPIQTPPPLPSSAPPIASSSSASTSASTSTATNTASSTSTGRPPAEATIRCQWNKCDTVIIGVQNFGKHMKKEHKVPVVQHGRQSGPVVQCHWVRCNMEVAGLELYVHLLQVHLKFGYQCRGTQKDGKSRCEYRPIRLDTLERHYKAVHPGVSREWDEVTLLP